MAILLLLSAGLFQPMAQRLLFRMKIPHFCIGNARWSIRSFRLDARKAVSLTIPQGMKESKDSYYLPRRDVEK
jgi:hypothetical protein